MGFTPEGGFTKRSRWLYKEEQVAAAPGTAVSPLCCWELPFVTRRVGTDLAGVVVPGVSPAPAGCCALPTQPKEAR